MDEFSTRGVDPVSGSRALGPDLFKIFKIPKYQINARLLLCIFYFLCQTFHRCTRSRKPARIRIRIHLDRIRIRIQGVGLTEDVRHQKYENKKEGLQNYPEYSINSISNIFYHSGYRALDPEFGQNRIHTPAFDDL